jgi:hypothetical protein
MNHPSHLTVADLSRLPSRRMAQPLDACSCLRIMRQPRPPVNEKRPPAAECHRGLVRLVVLSPTSRRRRAGRRCAARPG